MGTEAPTCVFCSGAIPANSAFCPLCGRHQPKPETAPNPAKPAIGERLGLVFGRVRASSKVFAAGGGVILLIFIIGWLAGSRNPSGQASAACRPFDPGTEYQTSNRHELSGSLLEDTYMIAGEEYTIAAGAVLTVPNDITLIIEPGARVKFGAGAKLMVGGRLLACGTRTRRILFTADATTGSPGFWSGIELRNAEEVVIGHANFEFAGEGGRPAVWVENSDLLLEDVRFSSNQGLNLSLHPGSFPAVTPPIENESGPAGWEIRAGSLSDDLVWQGLQPLIINGRLEVPEDVSLTIAAGSHVKFLSGASLAVYGRLIANGTAQARILLTSADEASSDFNNVANEAWSGLFFFGDQAQGEFSFVEFRYLDEEGG